MKPQPQNDFRVGRWICKKMEFARTCGGNWKEIKMQGKASKFATVWICKERNLQRKEFVRNAYPIAYWRTILCSSVLLAYLAYYTSIYHVRIISPPENDSFRKDLCFSADVYLLVRPKTIVFGRTSPCFSPDVLFIYCNARSPRCMGRPAWNFAQWSVLGPIL